MISIESVYIQNGYSGYDHLKPVIIVDRTDFKSRTDAMDYYRRRYGQWAYGIIYWRRRRGGDCEKVGYGPRTDGRVNEGMYVEFVPSD